MSSALVDAIHFDERGLVPAVVSDAERGAVLMLAWMNREAVERTLATGLAHFWSRSRGALWRKGESSGNHLEVRELRLDCDGDALLVVASPAGPTCHTGATSCFFRAGATLTPDDGPAGVMAAVLDRLYQVLLTRRAAGDSATSYTASLFAAGLGKINAKIAEEQAELGVELGAGPPERVVAETADLLFHVLVGLAARDVAPDAVFRELERRFGQSGHAEKAARKP